MRHVLVFCTVYGCEDVLFDQNGVSNRLFAAKEKDGSAQFSPAGWPRRIDVKRRSGVDVLEWDGMKRRGKGQGRGSLYVWRRETDAINGGTPQHPGAPSMS